MTAPDRCCYCDHMDPNCGFCEMGKPLDTQADWDASWGRVSEDAVMHAWFVERQTEEKP